MTPTFHILANGSDISGDVASRLISMTITDSVDENSDGFDLMLEDSAGTLALPASGAKLDVSLGYDGNNQRMGSFVVDEASVEGPPDRISVQASSTPFVTDRNGGGKASFTSRKSRSFEGKTLGDIVQTIAGECGLTPVVDSELSSVSVPYVAQTDESDANLLVRLARRYGGVLKPADGRLVLASEAGGRSTSGQALEITLTPADVTNWRVTNGGKSQGVTKVKAKTHDYAAADIEEVEVEVADDQFGLPEGQGSEADGSLLPPLP
jgi:phage protein D